jgi:aspartate kinase
MKVFKFGGASVKDPEAVKNVAHILSLTEGEKRTVVVSAMGKSTNKLEDVVQAIQATNEDLFTACVNELYAFHIGIIEELFHEKTHPIYSEIEKIFERLRVRYNQPFSDNYSFEYDQIVSLGKSSPLILLRHIYNKVGILSLGQMRAYCCGQITSFKKEISTGKKQKN